jgi:hypothetical protein
MARYVRLVFFGDTDRGVSVLCALVTSACARPSHHHGPEEEHDPDHGPKTRTALLVEGLRRFRSAECCLTG